MKTVLMLTVMVGLLGCQSSPQSGSVPVSTQGAQNIGGGQGQAQETGSATSHANPTIYGFNLIGKSKLVIKVTEDGMEMTATAEGLPEGGAISIGSTYVTYGEEAINTSVSSGGGGQAGTQGGSSSTSTTKGGGSTDGQ